MAEDMTDKVVKLGGGYNNLGERGQGPGVASGNALDW